MAAPTIPKVINIEALLSVAQTKLGALIGLIMAGYFAFLVLKRSVFRGSIFEQAFETKAERRTRRRVEREHGAALREDRQRGRLARTVDRAHRAALREFVRRDRGRFK